MEQAIKALKDKITEAKSMKSWFESQIPKLQNNYSDPKELEDAQLKLNGCNEIINHCTEAIKKLTT